LSDGALIAARLGNAGATGELVERVDHPFLVGNPTALWANPGRLVALFKPTGEERRTPDALVARLVTARLALPLGALSVLVLDREDAQLLTLEGGLQGHFDETVELNSPGDWRLLVKATRFRSEHGFAKIRSLWWQAARQRLSFGEHMSSELRDAAGHQRHVISDQRSESLSVPLWTSRSGRRKTTLRTVKTDGNIAVVKPALRLSPKALRSACLTALRANYAIDTGIPYQMSDLPVLASAEWDSTSPFDPEWNRRVLAFAGAVPVAADLLVSEWEAAGDTADSEGGRDE